MLPPFKVSPTITGPRAATTAVTPLTPGSTSKFASTLASKKEAASAVADDNGGSAPPPNTEAEQALETFQKFKEGFIRSCSVLAPAEMPDSVEG